MNEQVEKIAEALLYGEPLWVYVVEWVEAPKERPAMWPPENFRATFKAKPHHAVYIDSIQDAMDKVTDGKRERKIIDVFLISPGPPERVQKIAPQVWLSSRWTPSGPQVDLDQPIKPTF